MDVSLFGEEGEGVLLNIDFMKKRRREKCFFMLKHIRDILRIVQKRFRLRGQ